MVQTSSPVQDPQTSRGPIIKPYPFIPVPPRTISSEYTPSSLLSRLRQQLETSGPGRRAQVLGHHDDGFTDSAEIFNGAVKTHAIILVKPISAADVSIVIKFCRQNDLDISVKAGGTGVHGWSVAGHVILDMSLMNDISVSLPNEATTLQESFAHLKIASESQRSSIASTHHSSDSTTTSTTKRSFADASLDEADGQRKETRYMKDITEEPSRTSSRDSRDVEGDQDMSRTSSNGNTGSTRSDSASRDGQDSTPATSIKSSQPSIKLPSTSFNGSNDNSPAGSSSSSSGQSRFTYVNPSPTAIAPVPFFPTSFGAGSTSGVSFNAQSFQSNSRLALNTNLDPPSHTIVTFGAGVGSKQLDAATAASPYGAFHVPTSAFPVGAGQFVLGGFGFLGRKHGLAMDNLVEAELVLPDGRIVWVGEGGKYGGEWKDDENQEEVWWGLRGAGPSLGVITRFRAKGHYVPSVYAGNLIYVFDKATTPSLLRHVRDCIKGSPRSLYTNIIMTAGPPGSPAIVVIQLCFSGPRAEGDIYIQAISSWEGGRCLFQDFSERTFERQQLAVEEVLKGGKGRKWYIKSDMLLSLSDEVIDQTCARFHIVPDGCTWLFEYVGGGCSAEVKDSVFPLSHRESAFTVAALHQWGHTEKPEQDTRCVVTAEDWVNEVIHANSPGGPLPCFLQSSERDQVAAVYGENWSRLERLKAKIDPTNLFKNAGWPRPNAKESPAKDSFLADGDPVELDGQAWATGEDLVDSSEAHPNVPIDKGKLKA